MPTSDESLPPGGQTLRRTIEGLVAFTMDVARQVDYWRKGAEEDFAAAEALLKKRHQRHALFFGHLAIEKTLKAHVARALEATPPRTHDLLRLADTAEIALSDEQREFLARFQQYCLEGRYPDYQPIAPSEEEAESGLRQAGEMLS